MDEDQRSCYAEAGHSNHMKGLFETEQENFWHGNFGDDYTMRNARAKNANYALFSRIISRTDSVDSIIEFGSNIGLNLQAIEAILPECKKAAVEINRSAISRLRQLQHIEIFDTSVLNFESERKWDLVLTKGLLIHISPDNLDLVYDKMFSHSRRYICLAEYYNPTPVTVLYRGSADRLFKRDFAGELMDRFPSIRLIDYGFCYHRDSNFRQDDITWFLLEKSEIS